MIFSLPFLTMGPTQVTQAYLVRLVKLCVCAVTGSGADVLAWCLQGHLIRAGNGGFREGGQGRAYAPLCSWMLSELSGGA